MMICSKWQEFGTSCTRRSRVLNYTAYCQGYTTQQQCVHHTKGTRKTHHMGRLREFVKLTSSCHPARVEVGLLTALDATTSAGPAGPAGSAGSECKLPQNDLRVQFHELKTCDCIWYRFVYVECQPLPSIIVGFVFNLQPLSSIIMSICLRISTRLHMSQDDALQREPKDAQMEPKVSQRTQKEPNVSQREAKGVPKTPKGSQRKPKGTYIYIYII